MDGDKIAALAASFFSEQLRELGLPITGEHAHPHEDDDYDPFAPGAPGHAAGPPRADGAVSVGVVQTAYANGASSRYIRESLGLPIALTKTCGEGEGGGVGVWGGAPRFVRSPRYARSPQRRQVLASRRTGLRHWDLFRGACEGLTRAGAVRLCSEGASSSSLALQANGHGTVLFHAAFLARLHSLAGTLDAPRESARRRLLAASEVINQAVGDALSDLLFTETVLTLKGWSVQDWDGVYTDLPSRQTKLAVADRAAVVTTEDETSVIRPVELQVGEGGVCVSVWVCGCVCVGGGGAWHAAPVLISSCGTSPALRRRPSVTSSLQCPRVARS